MAQKVAGFIKLQIPAGKATPAPPVGPALGQHGVNIMSFTKEFNERTKNDAGMIIPVVITVYADRSFTFVTKTPPAAVLIKKGVKFSNVIIFMNAWCLTKISTLLFEFSALGLKFTLVRLIIDIPGVLIMSYFVSLLTPKNELEKIYNEK